VSATARDFMPWSADSGQKIDVQWFSLGASSNPYGGEPCYVTSGNVLKVSGSAPAIVAFGGIAAAPFGYKKNGTTVTRNPRTGTNFAQYDMCPVWIARPGSRFVTPNFYVSGTATTPTRAHIGVTVSIVLVSSTYGVDTVATTAALRVWDVLDKNRKSVQDPTSDGYTAATASASKGVYVIVEVVQSQWVVNTALTS